MLKPFRQRDLLVSFLVNVYVAASDWIIRPLHARGIIQPLLSYLDGMGAVLEFPGLALLTYTRMRPTYRVTGWLWWMLLLWNILFWIVAAMLLRRLFALGRRKPAAPAPATHADVISTPTVSRRTILSTSVRVAAAGAGTLAAYSFFIEPTRFQITRRRVPLRDLSPALDGLRIVQLTDIHHGPTLCLAYVRRIVQAANALRPDVILLTGDYVYRSPKYIRPVVAELAQLRAATGIVGVLGNHDWWENGPLTQEAFADIRIPLIDNTRLFINTDRKLVSNAREGLCIAGVGDFYTDAQRYADALGGVPDDMPRLLLSHNPDVAEEHRFRHSRLRVDLMLSGHTHGGQIRIPGIGTPLLPSRYGQKYARGLVQGPVCPVFISRGIGTTALPMRFCIPPEISLLEFTCA